MLPRCFRKKPVESVIKNIPAHPSRDIDIFGEEITSSGTPEWRHQVGGRMPALLLDTKFVILYYDGKGACVVKKRVAHLVFCSVYCMLALIGLLADFGAFGGGFTTRPFVFYTSLSNMLCSTFMVISLFENLVHRKVGILPLCKFLFVVMILLTAIVFNLLLNSYKSVFAYFAAYKSALYHLVLPVMFFLDWIFFYRRGKVKPHARCWHLAFL